MDSGLHQARKCEVSGSAKSHLVPGLGALGKPAIQLLTARVRLRLRLGLGYAGVRGQAHLKKAIWFEGWVHLESPMSSLRLESGLGSGLGLGWG